MKCGGAGEPIATSVVALFASDTWNRRACEVGAVPANVPPLTG
jgi:hypothetical protein